jgi:diaminopimelate epimerase
MRKNEFLFTAVDGDHKAVVEDNGWIDLQMKDVDAVKKYDVADYILDTGSPHLVKPVPDVWNIDVVKDGRNIRYNQHFKDKGINVNFVEMDNEGAITVRTYERGVEDETLSCGTGVTASALMFAHNDNGFNRVEVKTRGGRLAVEFYKYSDSLFKDIWLCGPATFVFKGEINLG